MIDTAGISLAALVERDGVTLRGGTESAGPCPKCGGFDRFHLREYDGREYFFCRQCHEQRGDVVEYMQWLHGLSFVDALAALGLRGHAGHTPQIAHRPAKPRTAAGVEIPPELDDPPAAEWQAAAAAFVDDCAARLWTPAGAASLAYLRGRGLSDDAIKGYRLGWHWPANAVGVKLAGQWWAHRGITIPRTYAGELWAVNVRRSAIDYKRAGIDGKPAGGKLKLIQGSKAQLFNGDTLAAGDVRHVLVCAGELDCILAQQHAPAGVACVTFGSESKGPAWEVEVLLRGKSVYIAFDNDDAGEKGAAKWAAIGARVQVPEGKDITDYAKAGGDVAAWIAQIIGAQPWHAPTDEAERFDQAKHWLAIFDDEARAGGVRAQAWARMCVCLGEAVASDGASWLALAQ